MRKTLMVVAVTLATSAAAPAAASAAVERLPQPGTPFGGSPTMQAPAGLTPAQKIAFWRTLKKIVVCASAIGAFVLGNAIWITRVRKAGGIWKTAKRVLTTRGRVAKLKVLGGIFGNVLGLDTIAEKC